VSDDLGRAPLAFGRRGVFSFRADGQQQLADLGRRGTEDGIERAAIEEIFVRVQVAHRQILSSALCASCYQFHR